VEYRCKMTGSHRDTEAQRHRGGLLLSRMAAIWRSAVCFELINKQQKSGAVRQLQHVSASLWLPLPDVSRDHPNGLSGPVMYVSQAASS
jgi:hypothetical protein